MMIKNKREREKKRMVQLMNECKLPEKKKKEKTD